MRVGFTSCNKSNTTSATGRLTIYTLNHQLIYDLLGESRGSLGTRKQLTSELAVRYDSTKIRTAFGLAEMVQITLIVAEDITERVGASLIVESVWGTTGVVIRAAVVRRSKTVCAPLIL
jgi:hypothetical protein